MDYQDERRYALLSDIAYKPMSDRDQEAQKHGYRVVKQDDDRVYFESDTHPPVIAFRGTDLKSKSRMWRDIYTDTAVLFGKFEKSPRAIGNEAFVQDILQTKKTAPILTGHSLGGLGASIISKEYGLKGKVYNPAFGIPEVAKSFRERILEQRRIPQLEIYTTGKDPISMGAMFSLTGKVYKKKPKAGISSHALQQFL